MLFRMRPSSSRCFNDVNRPLFDFPDFSLEKSGLIPLGSPLLRLTGLPSACSQNAHAQTRRLTRVYPAPIQRLFSDY